MIHVSSEALWATVMTFLFLSIPPFSFCIGQLLLYVRREYPQIWKSMDFSWGLFDLIWIGRRHPVRDERWARLRDRARLFGVIGVTAAFGAFLLEWLDV